MSRAWMPLYVADYLADTAHLSAAEHGAYLLLIMHYWQHDGLPDDPKRLARIARMTPEEWSNAQAMLADFFEEGWKHKRIDAELAAAAAKYEKRAAAGKKGGNAKAFKRLGTKGESSNAVAMLEPSQSNALANGCQSQSQSHIDSSSLCSEESPKRGKRVRTLYPPAFEEFWSDYPTDSLMSKKEAHKAWERLSPEDREKAHKAVPAFKARCAADPTYRPVHCCRFLSQRRFDGFLDEKASHYEPIATPPRFAPPVSYAQAKRDETNRILDELAAKRAAKANGGIQ